MSCNMPKGETKNISGWDIVGDTTRLIYAMQLVDIVIPGYSPVMLVRLSL